MVVPSSQAVSFATWLHESSNSLHESSVQLTPSSQGALLFGCVQLPEPLQTWPAGQLVPHEPQLNGSLSVSAHKPLQLVWPGGQLMTHVLP